jgi:inhibitor of cysteine peptidase
MAVIRIDARHNGQRVEASPGDSVELVLPENATTGFQWQLEEPADPLRTESSDLVPPDDARAGAAGQRRVVVRAVRPGSGRLELLLRRSWEPPEQAQETYTVDIDVS